VPTGGATVLVTVDGICTTNTDGANCGVSFAKTAGTGSTSISASNTNAYIGSQGGMSNGVAVAGSGTFAYSLSAGTYTLTAEYAVVGSAATATFTSSNLIVDVP
jgi:hypothetical protein